MNIIKIKTFENVKLSEIKEGFNPRADFSGVDELVKSIESVGLLQPVVVRKDGEKFILVDGSQRLRALKTLDQKETQAIVIDAKSADEAQMAANLMRSDLNILERARGYERLVRLMPSRYNAASVAKTFCDSKKSVERLISVAKRIPANFDGKLGPMIGQMDFEDLEMLAQVPAASMGRVIDALDVRDPRFYHAIGKVAKSLDYSCDALTTGKLVSTGRAFVIKNKNNHDSAYTTDAAAYKEAKDAYEAKHKQQYGAQDKANKEKVVEKSEKQKAVDRAVRKKEKDARAAAVKELPALFQKFIVQITGQKDIDALGLEVCEKHLDSDKCRRLWAAFGIEGCSKVSSYELRSKTWDKVFSPIVKTPSQIARLRTFLTFGWKDGKTPEQAWVEGMKK